MFEWFDFPFVQYLLSVPSNSMKSHCLFLNQILDVIPRYSFWKSLPLDFWCILKIIYLEIWFVAKNSIAWSTSLRKGQVAGKASLRKHLEERVNGFNCVEGDQTFKLLLNLDKTNFLAGSDSNQSAAHCFFSPEFTNKVVMSSPVPLLGLQQPPAPSNKSFPPIRRDWHHDFFYTKTILLCNCSSWSNTCMSNSSNEYPACPFLFYF